MNIIVASSAGFCFGVNRAYNLVQSEILANSPIERVMREIDRRVDNGAR